MSAPPIRITRQHSNEIRNNGLRRIVVYRKSLKRIVAHVSASARVPT